jgi:hypothetical protein
MLLRYPFVIAGLPGRAESRVTISLPLPVRAHGAQQNRMLLPTERCVSQARRERAGSAVSLPTDHGFHGKRAGQDIRLIEFRIWVKAL